MKAKAITLFALSGIFSLFSYAGSDITIQVIEVLKPSCNGLSNGSIQVEAQGGEGPYEYNWNTFPNQFAEKAQNLSAGVYFVHVKDANGNTAFTSIEMSDPSFSLLTNDQTSNIKEVDLTASVQGKSAGYDYELNNELISSQKITDLETGVHKLVVTDADGCTMVQYLEVFYKVKDENTGSNFKSSTNLDSEGKQIRISNLYAQSGSEMGNFKIKLKKIE
ncbi:SprB repeat-containing protein [Paracrocinitomix mangrovi]|uniref:SprB repeat-containing protein n=1 Tax=Paracrocinitomix mangrovi TaxID=2862509 RepID=UPI001C8ECBFE|nr:SprB repeat-containing protein [Paracrocinitomix mangrovi]UKN00639.1 SprB repeat-containing protein [Paracrocinitomix mangrovi]